LYFANDWYPVDVWSVQPPTRPSSRSRAGGEGKSFAGEGEWGGSNGGGYGKEGSGDGGTLRHRK